MEFLKLPNTVRLRTKTKEWSQKSTPWLDFIATPDPKSQQEFLTYPNSIATQPTI